MFPTDVEAPIYFKNDPPLKPYYVGFYPIRAIFYFFSTPALWKIIICPIIITLIIAILTLIIIFGALLYPQYLAIVDMGLPVWAGWLISVILCLAESLIIILLLSMFFIEGTRRRVYRKVFEIEKVTIEDKTSSFFDKKFVNNFDTGCCTWIIADTVDGFKNLFCCFFKPDCLVDFFWMKFFSLFVFLISLPLNLIPGLGTVFFVLLNGYYMAWRMQDSYLEKKGLSFKERKYFVGKRMSEFLCFGSVCMTLDMIPIVNVVLVYSNIVASGT